MISMWVVICLIVYVLVETGKICFFFIYNRKDKDVLVLENKPAVIQEAGAYENKIYKKTREIRKAGEK